MMITSEEIKKMEEKLGIIIKSYLSSAPVQNDGDKVKDVISAEMLQAAFNYLLRLPFVSPLIASDFLDNLKKMIECKIDFAPIFKAGVLLGLSEDYSRFKRYIKRNIINKSQENKILQEMLETVKKQGFGGEIRSSGLHITCPNEYRNVEEAVLEIKNILLLDEKIWEVTESGIGTSSIELIVYKRHLSSKAVLVKDDLFYHTSRPGGEAYFFSNDKFKEHENCMFYAIYQDHLLDPSFYRLEDMLYHYFCVKNGVQPDNRQLERLRMKYYRCIRKAYPRGVEIINPAVKDPNLTHYISDPTIHMGNHPNIFYLSRRPYATTSKSRAGKALPPKGKLLYDLKDRSFYLMPGTRIVIHENKSAAEYSTADEIFFSGLKHGDVVKREIDTKAPPTPDKTKSAKGQVDVAFVRNKIKVNSPTLAAQLVLGYKRSGLTYWRNNKGKCLGDYLKEIGHLTNPPKS